MAQEHGFTLPWETYSTMEVIAFNSVIYRTKLVTNQDIYQIQLAETAGRMGLARQAGNCTVRIRCYLRTFVTSR